MLNRREALWRFGCFVAGSPLLISETTYQAVSRFIQAEALAPVTVKGKEQPVLLYSVSGLLPGAPLGTAPAAPPPLAPRSAS